MPEYRAWSSARQRCNNPNIAMLRAIMLRQGGQLLVTPDEMPAGPFSIMWRPTPDGGLEAKLEDGKIKQ